MKRLSVLLASCLLLSGPSIAATESASLSASASENLAKNVQPQVVKWRRHFHQHPELSNEEFNTGKTVAKALEDMGIKVETGIAGAGLTGFLQGSKPGPTVALRADMDGLPVVEQTDLPFASKTQGKYRGKDVGVMHACGHDAHMAILLGVAKSLSDIKNDLAGNVLFIFQPAEEGLPAGEVGGAELMLKEGLFEKHKPDVVYGLHVWSALNTGTVAYRSGPAMSSADVFEIVIKGKQTHGSRPWGGVDPIVVAAQTIMAVQTIASRQVDVTKAPSIISFGIVEGGVRNNIIPDSVKLVGTIRNFDMGIRAQIHQKIKHTAKHVALAAGAEADVTINLGYPVMVNDPALVKATLPSLLKVVGDANLIESDLVTGAEDFAYFANEIPGFYYFVGVTPKGVNAKTAPSNHSPYFDIEESAMQVGVQTLLQSTLDYMARH